MKHWEYHPVPEDDCFGCKALGLQINTGDAKASNGSGMTNKQWDAEIGAYANARKQGIQPAGTTMDKIIAAEKASENLGRAYNAEKDPNAKHINKQTAKTINELGA